MVILVRVEDEHQASPALLLDVVVCHVMGNMTVHYVRGRCRRTSRSSIA
jgi:hypothetical protein